MLNERATDEYFPIAARRHGLSIIHGKLFTIRTFDCRRVSRGLRTNFDENSIRVGGVFQPPGPIKSGTISLAVRIEGLPEAEKEAFHSHKRQFSFGVML